MAAPAQTVSPVRKPAPFGVPYEDPESPPGYPALALKIGSLPQFGIFRSYGALMARNLLYYQAELRVLENDLMVLEKRDHEQPERTQFAGNWDELSSALPPDDEQWRKFLEIREKIKEYCEVLVLASRVAAMEQPSTHELRWIQSFMETKEMGPQRLSGLDSPTWGSVKYPKNYAIDLVTIQALSKQDTFSNWLINRGLDFFCDHIHPLRKRLSKNPGTLSFQYNSLLKITHFISCTVAAFPPILAVVVLSYVSSFRLKIGLLAVFNLLLALCLSGFANASRAEVFAVMAAFDAIPVVFIASNQNSCSCAGLDG